MIRLVLFLLALALIAAGLAWFADRPGEIALTWMGYRVETSLMVAAVALFALIVLAILLWGLLRAVWRTPENVSLFFRHRRAMKGYQAVARVSAIICVAFWRMPDSSAQLARFRHRRRVSGRPSARSPLRSPRREVP